MDFIDILHSVAKISIGIPYTLFSDWYICTIKMLCYIKVYETEAKQTQSDFHNRESFFFFIIKKILDSHPGLIGQ